ncbi:HAD-IA family hydrolase [Liquorilactobacillus sicerae]|uniref:HAD-IA family hydrolase n=1 Tax=Liquorilactobacillus sicerae TaxID=1416943 RepID=UPI0024801DDE|nr:HAD-IA family hydrolase [Liquorilactobacillus sicerae]
MKNKEVVKQISTVFWDFDGTLYDTYPEMTASLLQAAENFNISLDYQQIFRHFRQTSVHQTFDTFFSEKHDLRQQIWTIYRKLESQHSLSAKPMSGVSTVCQLLFQQGKQQFLLTHRDSSAWQLLKNDDLEKFFTGGVTAEMKFARKPDPASLNYLCHKYTIDPATAVMIGDRPLDIVAGQRAGMQGWLFAPDELINFTAYDLKFSSYQALNQLFRLN